MSLRTRRMRHSQVNEDQWVSHLQVKSLAAELYRRTGIQTSKDKMHRVEEGLLRLHKEFGHAEVEETRSAIINCPTNWQAFVNLMTVNESYLFRDKKLLEVFAKNVLAPYALEQLPVRVWSAASSTGDEASTIAILCNELAAQLQFDWQVDGSDIDTEALALARAGKFELRQLKDVPQPLFFKYFKKDTDGRFQISASIREKINFFQHNLVEPLNNDATYQVIFLRNVLIYFDQDTRRRVLDNLQNKLAPNGYLFLGHAESLPNSLKGWEQKRVGDISFYQHQEGQDE